MFPSLATFGGIKGLLNLEPAVLAEPRTLRQTILGTASPPNPFQRHPDTCPVDYAGLVRDSTTANELGPLAIANGPVEATVVLVGGGIANIIAAYELSRVCIKVTLLEQADRLGGRLFTVENAGQPSELGAMRFPDRGLFWHYVGLWAMFRGCSLDGVVVKPFPNPGAEVPTLITYQGQTFPYGEMPTIFQEAKQLFLDFLNNLNDGAPDGAAVYFGHVVFALQTSPASDSESTARIESFWKAMIAMYDGRSFGDVLQTEVFARGTNVPNLLAAFGTLGLGTGGFGPLYEVAMLELLRILLWEYQAEFSLPSVLDDPKLDSGMQGFAQGLAELAFQKRQAFDPSATFADMFQLNTEVTSVLTEGNGVEIGVKADGVSSSMKFDFAVVGMTTRAMQRLGVDLDRPGGLFEAPYSNAVLQSTQAAIRRCNLMSAYKMFLTLPEPALVPDWPKNSEGQPIRNFLTDGFPRASYVLPAAAGNNTTSALVSYAWGVDALKYEQLSEDECQATISDAYLYGSRLGVETSVFGKAISLGNERKNVVWNTKSGFGGGFKLDKPEDNYFTNSLFYHFQLARTPFESSRLGSGVFFAGDSVGHLGGWVEGACMSAINAVVAVCSELDVKTNAIKLRDQSVAFLLEPASNLFHSYKFIQGDELQFTGLLEMQRLGSKSGDPSAPPSSYNFADDVQVFSVLSAAVSSDGNVAVTVQHDGTVWLRERNAEKQWRPAVQISALSSVSSPIVKVALDSYAPVNGVSPWIQLMAITNDGSIFHGIRTAGVWSSFQQPYSVERAKDCSVVLDDNCLQFVLVDNQNYLRHGIRFPDARGWTTLNYVPGLDGAPNFQGVSKAAIGSTGIGKDIQTVAVIDLPGKVWVAMRYGKEVTWSPWQGLSSPEGVENPNATHVAVVVQDDLNHAQLVAAFEGGKLRTHSVYSCARYMGVGPSLQFWTPLRKVPYPMGGEGREVRAVGVSRLTGLEEECIPAFSTSIFATVDKLLTDGA